MNYKKWKQAQQAKVDDLHLKFAFGNEQFEMMLKEWDLTTENMKEHIFSIGHGGYALKKDKDLILNVLCEKNDLKQRMKDDDFLKSAYMYEMSNHECGYTYDFEPMFEALNLKKEKLTKRKLKIYEKTRQEYLEKCV